MSGQIVAKLAYPLPAAQMIRAVKTLEALYGKGLMVDFEDPEAREWMVVRRPEATS